TRLAAARPTNNSTETTEQRSRNPAEKVSREVSFVPELKMKVTQRNRNARRIPQDFAPHTSASFSGQLNRYARRVLKMIVKGSRTGSWTAHHLNNTRANSRKPIPKPAYKGIFTPLQCMGRKALPVASKGTIAWQRTTNKRLP